MSTIAPGWYKDPVDPTIQRYWDGEGWIGDPIPADATPPEGPPAPAAPPPPAPAAPTVPAPPSPTPPPGWPAGQPYPYPGGPPPQPHGFPLAELGSRFAARVVDIIAVFALCAVANAWLAVQWWQVLTPFLRQYNHYLTNGGTQPEVPPAISYLFLLMLLVTTAVWFAYEVPSSANSGQTLGKRLLGIKVVALDSPERLGFGRAFRRWARLGVPTLLWTWQCFGIGFILQFIDCVFVLFDRPYRQALHDKVAATVVVQVTRTGPTKPASLTNATSGDRHADAS